MTLIRIDAVIMGTGDSFREVASGSVGGKHTTIAEH